MEKHLNKQTQRDNKIKQYRKHFDSSKSASAKKQNESKRRQSFSSISLQNPSLADCDALWQRMTHDPRISSVLSCTDKQGSCLITNEISLSMLDLANLYKL